MEAFYHTVISLLFTSLTHTQSSAAFMKLLCPTGLKCIHALDSHSTSCIPFLYHLTLPIL